MKKIISIFVLFLTLICYGEKIEKYDVIVSVNKDKSINIKENILYNPEGKLTHGLIRNIIKDNVGNIFSLNSKVGIKDFKSNLPVMLERGTKLNSYRLGDKDVYLPEDKPTLITNSYNIYNIIRTDDKTSQIFLNVIGQYWDMDIEEANITLNVDNNAIKDLYVFTGPLRSQTNNYTIDKNTIRTKYKLKPYEGLTFKLNLDKKIYSYTMKDRIFNIINAYTSLTYNLAISFVLLILFIIVGILKKKFKDNRPIEPVYKIDEKISPSLAYMVYKKNISIKPVLYNLLTVVFYSFLTKKMIIATDKYEDVEYILKKGEKVKEKEKYKLKWEDENEKKYSFVEPEVLEKILLTLPPEEKKAALNLFRSKDDLLKNKEVLMKTNLELNGYVTGIYKTNVGSFVYLPMVLTIVIAIITFVINVSLLEFNVSTLLPIALLLLNIFTCSSLMIFTKEGKDILRNIKGFLMYFNLTEKNIFKNFDSEKELIAYANKMLPYAIALNIRSKFISKIDDAIRTNNFDEDYIYSGIYYGYIYNFSSINNDIYINSMPKVENSNYSGGSFSSGSGGFSGGGFSGGGGSSW